DQRGGRRLHRVALDGDPGHAAAGGRDRAAAPHGRGDARDRGWPGRGDRGDLARYPAQPGGAQGPQAADRIVHLLRAHGRRQDRAGARARPLPVRRYERADPGRHVGIHGEVLGEPADRRAARLRRLRGLGNADQVRAAEALFRRAARRDREGASRRLQHPAAGARRRAPDGQLRPGDRLQEHGRHHDVERRRPRHGQGQGPRLLATGYAGDLRQDGREGQGRDQGRRGPRQGKVGVPRTLRHEGVIRKLSAVICVGSAVLAPRLARAQGEAPGAAPTAVAPDSIVVLGLRRVDRKQVLDQSGLTPGRSLGYRDVQRAVQALYATGQYDDVRVTQDTAGGRQLLVVRLHERPILLKWAVRGVSRISEGSVRDKAQLAEGRPLDPAAVARARGRIDSLYRAQGYYLAQAKVVDVYETDSARVRVIFDGHEGRRVAVA